MKRAITATAIAAAMVLSGCSSSQVAEPSSVELGSTSESAAESSSSSTNVTSAELSSWGSMAFLPVGEDQFEPLAVSTIIDFVPMYEGERIRNASNLNTCNIYDGVGSMSAKESYTSYHAKTVPQNSELNRVTLDRSVSSFIAITSEDFRAAPIYKEAYWSGNLFDYDGTYIEINGREADGRDEIYTAEKGYFSEELLNEILAEAGITREVYYRYDSDGTYGGSHYFPTEVWSSASPTSLLVGEYEGTVWNEGNLHFETPYVLYGEKLEQTPTKDGYFIYDFSSVEAGSYFLWQIPDGTDSSVHMGTGIVVDVI